ncbi:MAG: hypothetical protein IPF71_15060 [Rhodoferax sp.]|nr:hypothetical protein [Rhodoferax sp.]
MIQLQVDEAKKQYDEAEARYNTIRLLSITAIVAGLLFAVAFGFVLIRSIIRQLGAEPSEAALLAQGVANGDLSLRIDLKAGDTTSLMAQLKAMQSSLQKVVSSVRQGSESVAAASTEIAQGNHDLSGRTEQQASALEETAASMEQTQRHRQAKRRQCPPGQPAGHECQHGGPSKAEKSSARLWETMKASTTAHARSPTSFR